MKQELSNAVDVQQESEGKDLMSEPLHDADVAADMEDDDESLIEQDDDDNSPLTDAQDDSSADAQGVEI